MTTSASYERSLSNVLAEAKGKIKFKYSSLHIFFGIWDVEESVLPTKYKEMFSDLSDVEIPLEMLSIDMELGEGTII